jgi:hypothetical protein
MSFGSTSVFQVTCVGVSCPPTSLRTVTETIFSEQRVVTFLSLVCLDWPLDTQSYPRETAPARHQEDPMAIDSQPLLDQRVLRGGLPLLPDRPVK